MIQEDTILLLNNHRLYELVENGFPLEDELFIADFLNLFYQLTEYINTENFYTYFQSIKNIVYKHKKIFVEILKQKYYEIYNNINLDINTFNYDNWIMIFNFIEKDIYSILKTILLNEFENTMLSINKIINEFFKYLDDSIIISFFMNQDSDFVFNFLEDKLSMIPEYNFLKIKNRKLNKKKGGK